MEKLLLPLLAGALLIWMRKKELIRKKILGIGLFCLGFAAVLTLFRLYQGDRVRVRELEQTMQKNACESVSLEVETEDGKEQEVRIQIPEKMLSKEEVQAQLEQAMEDLDERILGKNKSFDHVEWNLELPSRLPDSEISLIWTSDHPEAIGWDGKLQDCIPESGLTMQLTGQLSLGQESLQYRRILVLYPSREPEQFTDKLQKASEELNAENPNGAYRLPDQVDGENLTWYRKTEDRGSILCLLVVAGAALTVYGDKKKKEDQERARLEQLAREYPELVSKLQLLTAAGLSLRKSIGRLSGQYKELDRCRIEMESGVTEQEAYQHLGQNCKRPEYKKLALLLAQSQKKGGQQLSMLLEQETQEAFEGRKRRARVEGEKAAIRMVIPMGMMLVIVMGIIMVPALLSF